MCQRVIQIPRERRQTIAIAIDDDELKLSSCRARGGAIDRRELMDGSERASTADARARARIAFSSVLSLDTLDARAMEAFASSACADGVVERASAAEATRASALRTCALVDARSPGEYVKGHVPNAINVWLFDNEQRARVGRTYKEEGRGEALVLGMRECAPRLDDLVEACAEALREVNRRKPPGEEEVKEIIVMCFRGGMRSSCVGWLLSERLRGVRVRVASGGYKGFRKWALERCGVAYAPAPKVCVIGGRTGVGKTRALLALEGKGEQIIDLEGLANHAGSAFGWVGREPQPTSEHFSNLVACAWDALDPKRWVFIEDEGPHVGRCSVDPLLFARMRNAPLVIRLVAAREIRMHTLVQDYATEEHRSHPEWLTSMKDSVDKCVKRLGNVRVQEIHAKLENGDFHAVAEGLLDFYDELYDKHLLLKRKDRRGRGSGNDETSSMTSFSSNEEDRVGLVVDVHCRALESGAIDEETLVRDILCAVALFDCDHHTIEEKPGEEDSIAR